jgi:hypothetical protein
MMTKYHPHPHHHRDCSTISHKNVDCVSIGGDPGNEAVVCVYIINGLDPSVLQLLEHEIIQILQHLLATLRTQATLELGHTYMPYPKPLVPQLENLCILPDIADTF